MLLNKGVFTSDRYFDVHRLSHIYTDTPTHRQGHPDADTQTQTQTDRQTDRQTRAHTHTHTHARARAHARTHTHTHAHTNNIIIIIIAFKGATRDFIQSPHSAANHLQHVRSSGPGATLCKSRETHRALIMCKCHVTCHLVRRDSSAIKFDRVEIAFI